MSTLEVLSQESLPIIGFGFRPTDVELINYYLKPKINGRIKTDVAVIPFPEVDVYSCEPEDLPEKSLIKSKDHEWFFFAPKNRKYRKSTRWNRATQNGFWKATGKDRVIRTPAPSPVHIGMKKTLVFHRGRAPRGKRTRWFIHEYCTVEADFQQGGFVICRLFKKADDKKPTSNPEEIDSSGFSPALTRPSPDALVHGDDSLDEFTTTLPQESVPCNLDEIVDMIEKSVETQTHSYSDSTADVGASGIDMYNMKDYPVPSDLCNLNPECELHGSDVFYCNSPLDYYLNHLSFDDNGIGLPAKDEDGDSEFVADFLDAILVNNEDESPLEFNNYLENPSEAVPASQVCPIKHESPLDGASGIDSVIGDNADIEDPLVQVWGLPAKDEDGDSEFVADFLNAILVNNEDDSPLEFNNYLENPTVVLASQGPIKHMSPLDSLSGIDSVIGDKAYIDDLLLQEDPGFVSSCQLSRPMSPSSYFMSPTLNELGPQYDLLMVDLDHSENLAADELQCNFLTAEDMFKSRDDEPNNLFGVSDVSHYLSKIEPDPSNADNPTGIMRPQISANPNQQGHQAMAIHGTAVQRRRLQTSLRRRSTVIADGKSISANGGHDEKAEISESGKKTEFEAPTSNKAAEIAYSGSSDNNDNDSSWHAEDAVSLTEKKHPSSYNSQAPAPNPSRRLRTKDLNDLCVKPEDPSVPEAPKAATVCSGRVTVVIPVIISILCIGIGWFFSSR